MKFWYSIVKGRQIAEFSRDHEFVYEIGQIKIDPNQRIKVKIEATDNCFDNNDTKKKLNSNRKNFAIHSRFANHILYFGPVQKSSVWLIKTNNRDSVQDHTRCFFSYGQCYHGAGKFTGTEFTGFFLSENYRTVATLLMGQGTEVNSRLRYYVAIPVSANPVNPVKELPNATYHLSSSVNSIEFYHTVHCTHVRHIQCFCFTKEAFFKVLQEIWHVP